MLEKFQRSIDNNIQNKERILLAVSGGIDSMVMLHLFKNTKLDFGIAHCNFQLRGSESDEDEQFVRKIAADYNIPVYVEIFGTEDYAKTKNISIQMAARYLRYNWFQNLLLKHGYQKIALAHNLDDKIETFFINLIRGTGLRGIVGIKEINNAAFRPLLKVSRKEIIEYAENNNVKYREDSSNKSTKYTRNKIRHKILPVFKEISPSFLNGMDKNMKRFGQAFEIYEDFIQKEKEKLILSTDSEIKISIENLRKHNYINIIAFELFTEYEFSESTIEDIVNSLDNHSGLQFYSDTHRCIKDRNHLIITKIPKTNYKTEFLLDSNVSKTDIPVCLTLERILKNNDFQINTNSNIAYLDLDKLSFPLKLRRWKHGDYFYPLGMKNKQKISDFFNNNKFSIPEKESTWFLLNNNEIAWIIGQRIDDRYKLDDNTKNILKIKKG